MPMQLPELLLELSSSSSCRKICCDEKKVFSSFCLLPFSRS